MDMSDPEAVISPGGVGFDINCGVRLIRTNLMEEDVTPVKEAPYSADLDQDGFMPSNVDAELEEINATEAAEAEKTGRPLRIYKKKGLKRQTKRVNSAYFATVLMLQY